MAARSFPVRFPKHRLGLQQLENHWKSFDIPRIFLEYDIFPLCVFGVNIVVT